MLFKNTELLRNNFQALSKDSRLVAASRLIAAANVFIQSIKVMLV